MCIWTEFSILLTGNNCLEQQNYTWGSAAFCICQHNMSVVSWPEGWIQSHKYFQEGVLSMCQEHLVDFGFFFTLYRSLAKKGPWAEHLASLPKRGVGTLSTVSTFNHERAPTSCLQRLKPTQNNVQRNHQGLQSRVLTAHNTLNGTMWQWA